MSMRYCIRCGVYEPFAGWEGCDGGCSFDDAHIATREEQDRDAERIAAQIDAMAAQAAANIQAAQIGAMAAQIGERAEGLGQRQRPKSPPPLPSVTVPAKAKAPPPNWSPLPEQGAPLGPPPILPANRRLVEQFIDATMASAPSRAALEEDMRTIFNQLDGPGPEEVLVEATPSQARLLNNMESLIAQMGPEQEAQLIAWMRSGSSSSDR